MHRLGYTRYVAQGGDQGAGVTDHLARLAPDGLRGVHFNFLDAAPRELLMAALGLRLAFSEQERLEFGRFAGIPRWIRVRVRRAVDRRRWGELVGARTDPHHGVRRSRRRAIGLLHGGLGFGAAAGARPDGAADSALTVFRPAFPARSSITRPTPSRLAV
jgi:hypothetical protein